MLSLILTLSMLPSAPSVSAAPAWPCVWPNTCRSTEVAQFEPCVWPKTCVDAPRAQFETCVWPKRCA